MRRIDRNHRSDTALGVALVFGIAIAYIAFAIYLGIWSGEVQTGICFQALILVRVGWVFNLKMRLVAAASAAGDALSESIMAGPPELRLTLFEEDDASDGIDRRYSCTSGWLAMLLKVWRWDVRHFVVDRDAFNQVAPYLHG